MIIIITLITHNDSNTTSNTNTNTNTNNTSNVHHTSSNNSNNRSKKGGRVLPTEIRPPRIARVTSNCSTRSCLSSFNKRIRPTNSNR